MRYVADTVVPYGFGVRLTQHEQERLMISVAADLEVMARDSAAVRQQRPVLFTSLARDPGAAEVAAWARAVRGELTGG